MIKKRYKLILISLFAVAAAVCLFAGCKLSTSLDDVVNKYNLECRVTYFLNEGYFENEGKIKEMYYTANSRPLKITTETLASNGGSGSAQINPDSRRGYKLSGWYEVETNSEGIPLYTDGTAYDEEAGFEASKTISITDKLYDFNTVLQKGDHHYVCAKWEKLSSLKVHLICDGFDKIDVKDNDGNVTASYKTGDLIKEYPLDINVSNPGSGVLSAKGFSFVSFYKDLEATERFTDWPVRVPETVQEITIYAKYIEGTWEIVENSSGVAKMFQNGFNNYYFLPEVNEIDCSSLPSVNALALFEGEINGNGCTVKNLKITGTIGNGGTGSLFGAIGSTAKINDITFEDIDVTYTVNRGSANIYFICNSLAAGATFNNFTIGGTVNVKLQPNCELERESGETHWIYGGFANDADCNANINITDGTCYNVIRLSNYHANENNEWVYDETVEQTYTYKSKQ